MITREQIELAMAKLGHKYFTNGDYNVNIIGIRNSTTKKRVTNKFDDWMTLSFKVGGVWQFYIWPCTVDNGAGTARVKCGQYLGSHIIRKHQGKYEAVCQDRPLTVMRDSNIKDGEYNDTTEDTGVFGINIHKAGLDSTNVNNWSEGCQVFKKSTDFDMFLIKCKKAATLHGNRFTYTLIESNNFINPLD